MICDNNVESDNYNYVWRCTRAKAIDDFTIPMRQGDFLFVCVDKDGKAHFRYRKRDWRDGPETCENTDKNAELWANATAELDTRAGTIKGHLTGDRQFEMTIRENPKGEGFTLHCRHFFNPDEGDWDADDSWRSN